MHSHFKIAKFLAHLLDDRFKVGKLSFGLDPLFGLFPILGGLIPAALSFYLIWIGFQIKLPPDKLSQMIANVIFDYLLGLFPILGQAADFFFKSNLKNIKILEEYLASEIYEGEIIK